MPFTARTTVIICKMMQITEIITPTIAYTDFRAFLLFARTIDIILRISPKIEKLKDKIEIDGKRLKTACSSRKYID